MANETLTAARNSVRGDFGVAGLRVEPAAGASEAHLIESALMLVDLAHAAIEGADEAQAPDVAMETGLLMLRLARTTLEMVQRPVTTSVRPTTS